MRLALIGRPSWSRRLPLVGLGLTAVAVFAAVAYLIQTNVLSGRTALASAAPEPSPPAEPVAAATTVTLPEGKLRAAEIRVEPARREALPNEVVVTGTIAANPNRRVDIRPRVAGIVRTVEVMPSQRVKKGQVLATLESADVGTARLNVRQRYLELVTARTEADWKATIAANVERIIPELRKGRPLKELEAEFADKPLGNDRALLLAAYADLDIASHEEQKQMGLYQRQIVGEHPMLVAVHGRQSAQQKFEGAVEQVRFDAKQEELMAEQRVKQAEASVIDAMRRLQILLGTSDAEGDPLELADEEAAKVASGDVTAYPLTAPFDGTIVTLSAVFSQRAEPMDVLFTLADLETVWVVANIHESDFAALPRLEGATIRVTSAAYPDRDFEAKVLYVSQEVDPATRTVRLVAEAPNPDGLLKLGLFVQIRLESPTGEPVVTVPAGAVVEIEERPGVFVPGAEPRSFTFRPVQPGRTAEGRLALRAGVEPGEEVVAHGAFLLKSELILQNEPEEE